jgi:hypothetical protein
MLEFQSNVTNELTVSMIIHMGNKNYGTSIHTIPTLFGSGSCALWTLGCVKSLGWVV